MRALEAAGAAGAAVAIWAVGAVGCATPPAAAAAALPRLSADIITNGSFEDPQLSPGDWETFPSVSGWTATNDCQLELQNATVVPAYDGNQYLELASNCVSGVTQTLATTPGTTYDVSFVFRSRPDTPPSSNTTSITWNGKEFANLQGTDEWVGYHYDLTATSSSTVLQFADTDPSQGDSEGDFFDDVSVTPVTGLTAQMIVFPALADHEVTDGPFTVTASGGGSGNPVTFLSTTPSVCTASPSGDVTLTGVPGMCTLQASQAGGSGFASASPVTRSFAVTPPAAHITVTGVQTYGGTWRYTYAVHGLPTGSSLSGSLTCHDPAPASSAVGSYPVTDADCYGLTAPPPFVVTYTGSVTVRPAALTITAGSPEAVAGGPVPNLTAQYSGFLAGDTPRSLDRRPTCTTSATATSPAGTYATHCSGAAGPDYTITYADGLLTLTTAAATAEPSLPFTGSGAATIAPLAAVLLLSGAACLALSRRRRPASS